MKRLPTFLVAGLFLLAALHFSGCGDDTSEPGGTPDGAAQDVQQSLDTGNDDTGPLDVGADLGEPDTGPPDTNAPDTTEPDAAEPDVTASEEVVEPDVFQCDGCWIDGTCWDEWEQPPGNSCRICDATETTSQWTETENGTACQDGICVDGSCESGCYIEHTLIPDGATSPNDPCAVCDADENKGQYTEVDNGTVCAGGACFNGQCVAAIIDSIEPTCGPLTGGTTIEIGGSNFPPSTTVTIGGAAATVDEIGDTFHTLEVVSPPGSEPGPVDVVLDNGAGSQVTAPDGFQYYEALPDPIFVSDGTDELAPGQAAGGDVDGDGKTDVVVRVNGTLKLFRDGQPDGSFTSVTTLEGCTSVGGIAMGHVNDDNLADILASCGSDLQVWLGVQDGEPTLGPATPLPSAVQKIVVGLLNDDAHSDLVLVDAAGLAAVVWLGDGDSTFTEGTTTNTANITQMTLGDVTGDGELDLITSHYSANFIRVYPGTSAGTFTAPSTANVNSTQSITAADLDGDGKDEIVLSSADGAVGGGYLVGTADGPGEYVQLVGGGLIGATAADLSHDGRPDVIINTNPGLRIWLGTDDGLPCASPHVLNKAPYYYGVGDLDGDGGDDLFGVSPNSAGLMRLLFPKPSSN